MLLAINFHYIQPEGRFPYPGIYPTSEEQLDYQLGELSRSFEFISGDDLVRAATGETTLPERACLITFDDGLKEQFAAAAPILERHNVSGVFFICTQPLLERVGLTVHKMHRLRATRPPEKFLEQVLNTTEEMGLDLDLGQVDAEAANEQYLYDDETTKSIKYLLNHMLPFDSYRDLIDRMFSREMDEIEFCREMYMDSDEIRALSSEHTVGSHSHFHCPLAALSSAALRDSLGRSRDALERAIGKKVSAISYPYGGPTAVSESVAVAAQEAGFVAGFTMERSVNQSMAQPLLLARVATNDAPGGKSPLVTLDGTSREISVLAPMTAYRNQYFDEQRYLEEIGYGKKDVRPE
jgi:peptidoglycan/xylan/chitin deacetylase (PgdA/CDA1 family)